MKTQKMNGWSNRATWNVALWILNEERLYIAAQEAFCGEVRIKATDAALWAARAFPTGFTPDGESLRDVEWKEIARMIKEITND